MNEKLKHCPFCGEEARVEKINLGKQVLFRVICPECLTATTHLREEEKNAVAEWNTRPIEDLKDDENARLEKNLKDYNRVMLENARLREALKFYANADVYEYYDKYESTAVQHDGGEFAKKVLKEIEK